MLILGIETSCDETAAAVLEFGTSEPTPRTTIRAETVSSQVALHAQYGGVVPELASREHLKNLPVVLAETLGRAAVTLDDVDAIAVTTGPGLKGCLLTGMSYAEGLSLGSGKPLAAVNHIEGHLLAPLLDNPELSFPYLALVVSGGHTELVAVHGVGGYELLGRTQDDAAGEAFDKSANLLGLPYPGGAALARLADESGPGEYSLPRVFRHEEGFSFSGLKTAVARLVRDVGLSLEPRRGSLAYAIQEAIVDALVVKLERAAEKTGLKTVVLTGGVSANKRLRSRSSAIPGVRSFAPRPEHCIDNAAMIALAAGLRIEAGLHAYARDVRPRWWVEELGAP